MIRYTMCKTRDSQKELLYTDEERKELSLYLKDYMKEDESGDLKLYVPLVVRIENGKWWRSFGDSRGS